MQSVVKNPPFRACHALWMPLDRWRAKGPQTSQPKATPWVMGGEQPSPERARQLVPPFQGWFVFLPIFPGRRPGLACLRTFGAPSHPATGSGISLHPLRVCSGTQRRRHAMSIDGRQNRRDSSVGAARPAGMTLYAAPLELGRSEYGDAIDMPRHWRSAADFRDTLSAVHGPGLTHQNLRREMR